MSSTEATADPAISTPVPKATEFWLEVVSLPVSDIDRSKEFFEGLEWRLDADLKFGKDRVVQFTPPGSRCSISFGTFLTDAAPGSAQGLEMAVHDIDAARVELIDHGVEVSDAFHPGENGFEPGPDPEGRSYFTYASFSDPDGNSFLLQEIKERLPGR
jgi:catechol 2,3-dioxygenase-like lactoylglutathione lyase family enzyme